MTNILVFGAGKSSSYLIHYLLEHASKYFWQVTVADANINAAIERVGVHHFGTACQVEIHDELVRKRLISNANLVISLLPPSLHIVVAKDCFTLGKNLVTASYVSPEIKAMHEDVRNAGLLFMNEIGLDPGLDHMSAMKIIDEVEKLGGDIYSFKSYCGGLVAPSNDTNPWHYKISWNPRNIVLAGKAGADYLEAGFEKHLPYQSLFKEYEMVNIPGLGKLAAYANRDSLSYMSLYGLNRVKTMLRATFRYEDFCIGWNAIIQLGLTNETDQHETKNMTFKDWFQAVVNLLPAETLLDRLKRLDPKNFQQAKELIEWLGVFADEPIQLIGPCTSADILLHKIEEKWAMGQTDKDMIVMHHEFDYGRKNLDAKLTSTLIVEGVDKTYTAMAKTVGLPMAIFSKLFLTQKIKNLVGVQIPVMKEVYKPVLKELTQYGIEFTESYLD